MKAKTVKHIFDKYLFQYLPGYKVKGHLLFHQNIEYFLQGFVFESSSFSQNSFTIEVFVQPIYVPDENITITIGNRLGILAKQNDIWWKYDQSLEFEISQEILSMMVDTGLPFLEKRNSLEKFIHQYKHIKVNDNKYIVEALIYAYLLVGKYQCAEKMLVSFDEILTQDLEKNPSTTWMRDTKNRIRMVLGFLRNKEYEIANQKLDEWMTFTLTNLGL